MKMINVHAYGYTLPEAYYDALFTMYHNVNIGGLHGTINEFSDSSNSRSVEESVYEWAIVPVPNYNTRTIECCMEILCEDPLAEPRIAKIMPGGPKDLQSYVMEFCDGVKDFEIETGKRAYTYHNRMGEQKQFVIDELKRNPWSRQAVINFRTPEDMGSPDPACLQHMQFMIRNGRLDAITTMRSNDAWNACYMNMYAFTELQKEIAFRLNIPVGIYIHRANSFHVYERNWDAFRAAAKQICEGSIGAYNWEGDWKDQMREAIPEIMAEIEKRKEELKNGI